MAELSALMIPLTLAGSVMSAFGQVSQGQYAMEAATYNAQVAQQQAAEQAQASKTQAFDISVQRRQMIGRQIAGAGAAGVDVNAGTPLDLLSNTAAQYERDIQYAGIGAQENIVAGYEQAQIDLMQGRQAQMAGWMGGASSLFSGVAKAASLGGGYGGGGGSTTGYANFMPDAF